MSATDGSSTGADEGSHHPALGIPHSRLRLPIVVCLLC